MRTSTTREISLGLVLAAVLLWACGEEKTLVAPELVVEDPEAFIIDGTVEFLSVEGGCWAIIADDGTCYEPVGMPEEFYKPGLRVRAAVKLTTDWLSVCMVGTIVEVLQIKRYTSR